MKAVVVGSGGWGTALSMVLCDNGHDVTLWSHDPAKAAQMAEIRENSKLKGVRLPDALHIGGDLDCLIGADFSACWVTCSRVCFISRAARAFFPAVLSLL